MTNGDKTHLARPVVVPASDQHQSGWRAIRPRRPTSVWGWLILLLFALLLYLLITYVLIPWYRPVPTDVPPPAANSNTRRA